MVSSTHPPVGGSVRPADRPETDRREPGGLVTFGGVLLLLLGLFNLLDGIAAVNRSRVFVSGATYVVGDLRAWGWTILALGAVQLIAGVAVLAGRAWGRWFGVTVLSINALAQMFFIPAYPFWSLAIIAIDIVAIYGLASYGARRAVY